MAVVFQEFMVRSIRKSFGYGSIFFYTASIPFTFYNILFCDPAPYFTLCTYGCFAIEPCYATSQSWGNLISVSFVFALCFMLSAETLGILFAIKFLKLSTEQIDDLIVEVRDRFEKKNKTKDQEGEDDDDDDDHDNEDKNKDNDKDKDKDMKEDKKNENNGDADKTKYLDSGRKNSYNEINSKKEYENAEISKPKKRGEQPRTKDTSRFQNEFVQTISAKRPYDYTK